MKKIFLFLILLMCIVNVHATGKINKLIFFGDSLSDNGNLYGLTFHLIPKSPPYFDGRFSNGPTWAEYVGNYYHNQSNMAYKIYAYGGATALSLLTPNLTSPINLEFEMNKYFLDALFQDKSQVLFAIWIGGNDYLNSGKANPDRITTKVVDQISSTITTLITNGGKNFLIINLPDLSQIPKIRGSQSEAIFHEFTILHNQKLELAIQKLQYQYPEITVTSFNIYDFLYAVLADPDKYNQKYHTNMTHFFEACWTGGMWFSKAYHADGLKQEIQQRIAASDTKISKHFDAEALNDFIMQTPELAQTYQMGQSYLHGNVPCANPEEYFFWDAIHPTAVAHNILGQIIVEQLGDIG